MFVCFASVIYSKRLSLLYLRVNQSLQDWTNTLAYFASSSVVRGKKSFITLTQADQTEPTRGPKVLILLLLIYECLK
jgi:hypothetical protein